MCYICLVIESIKHKGLRLYWEKNDASRLPASQITKLRLILTQLHGAKEIGDMNFPGSDLHLLKGDLKGLWAVKASGNYRVVFRFEDGEAYDIDYMDYH